MVQIATTLMYRIGITGDRSKQDQILLVKICKYIGFYT